MKPVIIFFQELRASDTESLVQVKLFTAVNFDKKDGTTGLLNPDKVVQSDERFKV